MIKAKKSLGQNFLKDESVLERIVESANLSKEDVVIEIGPGMGALTEKLANVCKKVIAVELDDRLLDLLRSKFTSPNQSADGEGGLRSKENVKIIHGDILKINLPKLVETEILKLTGNEAKGYKVVANIPYYITAPIIRLLLETKYPPEEMILMVQKEVAERICANKGEMSILAVAVQYYAKPEYLFTVPKESFDPIPKVESAIIKVSSIVSSPFQGEDVRRKGEVIDAEKTKKFFRIVRAGFSAKRKTLANNLSSSFHLNKKEVEDKLLSNGFSKNVRAQELSVEEWKIIGSLLD